MAYLQGIGSDETPQVRDHGVSQAAYFHDPDKIMIELYHDRAKEEWPVDSAGNLAMFNETVELNQFLDKELQRISGIHLSAQQT